MTEPTTCQKCGKVIDGTKYGIGTGYGTTPEGAKWCYDCCTVSDIEELKERKPTAVYLSGDENSVTNWPGGVLGTVTRAHGIKHNMIRGRYVAEVVIEQIDDDLATVELWAAVEERL